MFAWLRSTLRHPFYPDLPVTPALRANGQHAVLAGSFQELAQAACRGARASRAVFLLAAEDTPLPGASLREQLWQWFRVPSYMLVRDAEGRLRAYECEAHEGFHVAADWPAADSPGAGELENAPCPCGRPGRRVSRIPKRPPQAAHRQRRARFLSA
jgi:hypothetical protein